jgi:hypothetical protein
MAFPLLLADRDSSPGVRRVYTVYDEKLSFIGRALYGVDVSRKSFFRLPSRDVLYCDFIERL